MLLRTLLPVFPVLWLLAPGLRGQEPMPLTAEVEKALATWRDAADKMQPDPQRALLALAESEAQAVTTLLLQATQAAAGRPLEASLLRALAKRPRPGSQAIALSVLERAGTQAFLLELAAVVVARQGNGGIDVLLDIASPDNQATKEPVRAAALVGLAEARSERAWRGLAPFLLRGTAAQRLRVLRLLDGVADEPVVTQARMRLLGEQNTELVAVAWRQLAQERHARAREFADDLLDKAGAEPVAIVRAELVRGLAVIEGDDHWMAWLRLAANDASPIRQAVRDATAALAGNAPFVRWLIKAGLTSDQPLEREVAMRVLRAAPVASLRELLVDVRTRLRKADPKALDLAIGLHELLAKDPSWREDLLAMADGSDVPLRTVGLQLLLLIECGDAVARAQQSIEHKAWELRTVAYRYLAKFRDVTSIPLLIARYDREDGRLEAELNQTLFVHTGTRCWKRADWESWWTRNKAGFALPPLAAVTNTKAGSGGGGNTVSYFDIPLVSQKMAFLVDISGSMAAKVGTGGNRTRLEEAKRQLARVVEGMPATHWCNVIVYETGVRAIWDKLRKVNDKNRAELLVEIKQLRIAGGTNIHDALEYAFADPGIDTIYLMTDGQPSAGKVTDPDDIVDQVRRWNLTRQLVIHCVAIGIDSELCKRLAADSGGTYVHVK